MTATATPTGTTAATSDLGPSWATTVLTGATMFVLLDISRILFPSIAFIFGRAGSTPPSEMGVFSFMVFLIAGVAARVAGINTRIATPVALAATVLARLALPLVDGGNPQLLAASLGLVAVVGLLGALAASNLPIREASRGLALGLLLSTTLHMVLGTQDGIWIGGALSWLVTAATIGALGYGWWLTRPNDDRPPVRTTIPWLLVGPILAFHGIAASTPAALRGLMGESAAVPAALLVAASAGGYVTGRLITSSFARESGGVLVMLPAVLAAVLLIGGDKTGTAAAASLLSAFVATLSLAITGESIDDPLASRARRSTAPAAGMMFTFIVVFGYYASYELKIGFPNGLLPAASAALIGLVLFRFRANDRPDPKPSVEDMGALALAPFVVLMIVIAAQVRMLPVPEASLQSLHVMTWNVHMGYDNDGRFNPSEIAELISAQSPDVLVLNEIDRGWLLSGGHDLLGILAQELQMDYVFGPAADALWGNAVLSRLPLENPVVTDLLGDAPMQRAMLQVEVVVGNDRLGIVATHLHHLADGESIRVVQAQQLAEAAQNFQLRGIPVLIMGDMNATPGSAPIEQLSAFSDLVAKASGGAANPTFPSYAPIEQLDQIYGTPGIEASDLHVPVTLASDHLPVTLTIRVPSAQPVASG